MVPLEDEFGDVVGKARRGQGIGIDDLAKEVVLEVEVIAAFEGYRQDPTHEQSAALAHHLGLDPGKLWEIATDAWAPRPVDTTLRGGLHVDQLWEIEVDLRLIKAEEFIGNVLKHPRLLAIEHVGHCH